MDDNALVFSGGLVFVLIANAVVALATFVQFTTGIGYAMIAMPLLALIDLRFVPGPALLTMMFLSVFMAIEGRSHINKQGLPALIAGLALGTLVAALILARLNSAYFGLVFGVFVLFAILIGQLGFHPQPNTRTFSIGGFLSGFCGTISGIHGPVLAVVFHKLGIQAVRATIAAVFVIACVLSLLSLAWQGFFDQNGMIRSLMLMPGLIAGGLIAHFSLHKLSERQAKTGMLVTAACSGVILIVRSLVEL